MPLNTIGKIKTLLDGLEQQIKDKETKPVVQEGLKPPPVVASKPAVEATHYIKPKKHQEEIAFHCVPNKPGLSPQRQMQCTQPKAQRDARACLGKKNKKKQI